MTTIVAVLVVGTAGYYAFRSFVQSTVDQYTSSESLTFTPLDFTEEEYELLRGRIDRFTEAMERGEGFPLKLTDRELNILVQRDPDWHEAKDKIRFEIADATVRARFSVAGSEFMPGVGFLEGRYITGEGELTIGLRNGELDVRFQSISLNGAAPPAMLEEALMEDNLASSDTGMDPEAQAFFGNLAEIRIEDNAIVLIPLNAAENASTEADDTEQ